MGGAGVDGTDDLAAEENARAVVNLLADDDQGGAIGGRAPFEGRLQADRLQDRQILDPTLPALGGCAGFRGTGDTSSTRASSAMTESRASLSWLGSSCPELRPKYCCMSA
jgi:hypothetical protein